MIPESMNFGMIFFCRNLTTTTELRNSSASNDVGLFFLARDLSRPLLTADYSIKFPIRHVASGLSLHFKPLPTNECGKMENCTQCMNSYFTDDGLCYWCHQSARCKPTFEECHFVTGNSTEEHCRSMNLRPSATKSHVKHRFTQNDHSVAGIVGISILIVVAVMLLGYCMNHGFRNPNSSSGQFLQALRISKLKPLATNSVMNLVDNSSRRGSTDTATTSL